MSENEVVHSAWRTLQASYPALPHRDDLGQEIADALAAQQRGYYLPDEDERLRDVYVRYLGARASLWTMIRELRTHLKGEDLQVFGLVFCAATSLIRSGSFLISLAKDNPVVWKKLDEAEPRFGLPRKSFTRIYSNLASPQWMLRYRLARKFYEQRRDDIHQALVDNGLDPVIPWLLKEEPHFETRKRTLWSRLMTYRLHSLTRRSSSGYTKVMFHLFRLSGSAIAEMKQPLVKPPGSGKRVTSSIQQSVCGLLNPGDVFITRHDDAMSNLFLPGYWPHAALYLGTNEQRQFLDLPTLESSIQFLEAKKDGVKYRPLEETLAVDAFVVLRPKINSGHLREALTRAMTHEGKLYDFIFDFRKADRLVCTEVVYRAYHGVGPCQFELSKTGGRLALSAEDLIKQALDKDLFEVVLSYGIKDRLIRHGKSAESRLRASLRRFS
ncbi:MAG: YiiX/YebB-like N1pC/P60 family cysteine hydrolase [Akkermansiaceae bacterium]